MPLGIGVPEIIIVLVIVLLLFGAKRLPEAGRALGHGMRGFKDAVTGKDSDDERERLEPAATSDAAPGGDGRAGEPAATPRSDAARDPRP